MRFLLILLFVVVVGGGVSAADPREVASDREFSGLIVATASEQLYTASRLTEIRNGMNGVSWEDAGKVIRIAMSKNIVQARLAQFGQTAHDVSKVMNIGILYAAEQIAEGISGAERRMDRLNAAFNFLGDKERKHVNDLFIAGKSEEARSFAFNELTKRYRAGAEKM